MCFKIVLILYINTFKHDDYLVFIVVFLDILIYLLL
jgi:hypothetical protein